MAIEVYWGSGSPFAWRVLLALEHKRLPYVSHVLQFSKQEHKSPHMLALNPRGKVPVLKDGDYVCFESLAILYYLDLKYPEPHIFGHTPEEAGIIMRVICEYQAYIEPHVNTIARAVFSGPDRPWRRPDHRRHAHAAGPRRAPSRGGCRSPTGSWAIAFSAVDMVIFPGIQLLQRALEKPRGARAVLALHAGGGELSGARPLAGARRRAARLRAHLPAALARHLTAAGDGRRFVKLSRAERIDRLHAVAVCRRDLRSRNRHHEQ